MKNTILILTNSKDGEHTSSVENKLRDMGKRVFRLDVDSLAAGETKLHFGFDSASFGFELKNQEGAVVSSDIASVWYRRPNEFRFTIKDSQQRDFAEREIRSLLDGLWLSLKESFWISDPQALNAARKKVLQWKLARELGFLVPDTLVTNNPGEVVDFYHAHQKRIVIKSLEQAFMEYPGSFYNMPTTLFPESALEKIEMVTRLPVLFQACIPKSYELRVTVIGDETFAVKIDSQEFTETSIDWRQPAFINKLRHELVSLPAEIQSKCLKMLGALNLKFGAFDIIVTPDNEYVFLEVNPNGQWYWMEHLIKVPLSDSLARALAHPLENKP